MPQLNPEFFISQLFWLAVFFSFLLVFLWRISLPRIETVLKKRQRKIDENLTSAKELQKEAQEIEKNINSYLTKAKQETDDQIKKTLSSLQDDVSSQLLSLDKDLDEKISNSEKEILANKDNQLKNINEEIAAIAKITVNKIADLSVSDKDINQAIKSHNGTLN